MKHLKAKIEELLFAICTNVFLEDAEDNSPFPYLVYSIKNGVNNHSQMIYTLDIDIWDKAETTEGIDELAKAIKKLDEVCYIDKNIFLHNLKSNTLLKHSQKHVKPFLVESCCSALRRTVGCR